MEFQSESKFKWQARVEAKDLTCLGVKLNNFSLVPKTDISAILTFLLIHESPLTDALFLLVSKSDEVTTT